MARDSQSHGSQQLLIEDLGWLIGVIEITKETLWSDGVITETFRNFFSRGNSFAMSAVKGKLDEVKRQ